MLCVLSKVSYFRDSKYVPDCKASNVPAKCRRQGRSSDIGAVTLPDRRAEPSGCPIGDRSCSAGSSKIGAVALPDRESEAAPLPGRSEKGTASSKSRYGTLSQNGYGDICGIRCSGYTVSCHRVPSTRLTLSPNSRPILQPADVGPSLRSEQGGHSRAQRQVAGSATVYGRTPLGSSHRPASRAKKLAAPEGLPRRSPTPVLTGPCNG